MGRKFSLRTPERDHLLEVIFEITQSKKKFKHLMHDTSITIFFLKYHYRDGCAPPAENTGQYMYPIETPSASCPLCAKIIFVIAIFWKVLVEPH